MLDKREYDDLLIAFTICKRRGLSMSINADAPEEDSDRKDYKYSVTLRKGDFINPEFQFHARSTVSFDDAFAKVLNQIDAVSDLAEAVRP